jgi:hypothetical protein
MSEWFYFCLLRIFPPAFRQRFEGEVLQLVRDRVRDERGFLSRLRLYSDLLVDLVLSLPRAYAHSWVHPQEATTATESGPVIFRTLGREPIHPIAIFAAGILTAAVISALTFVIAHQPVPVQTNPNEPVSPIARVIERLNQPLLPSSIHERPQVTSSSISESQQPVSSGRQTSPKAPVAENHLARKVSMPDAANGVIAVPTNQTSANGVQILVPQAALPPPHSASIPDKTPAYFAMLDGATNPTTQSNIDFATRPTESLHLTIANGTESGTNRADGITIMLNGKTIASRAQVNQDIGTFSRDIALEKHNTIRVTVEGGAKSHVLVVIQ